jgi:lysophospholipase L1-like esterase
MSLKVKDYNHRFFNVNFIKIITLLPLACILTFCTLYSQNTLFHNDKWIVQKRMAKLIVMGSDDFFLTRVPLFQNSLDLGRYFGYQEILLKEQINPKTLQFKFKINNDSYLDIIYNLTKEKFNGIRISRRSDSPSMIFESNPEGKFLKKIPIDINIESSRWNLASIAVEPKGLALNINDRKITSPSIPPFSLGSVGFRSGILGAIIDDINIQLLNGKSFTEDFNNTKNWFTIFILNYLLLLILSFFIFHKRRGKDFIFSWAMVLMTATTLASLWFFFDFFYYSNLTHRLNGITKEITTNDHPHFFNFEKIRRSYFLFWSVLAGEKIVSYRHYLDRGYPIWRIYQGPIVCSSLKNSCLYGKSPLSVTITSQKELFYRTLFVGTSQTIGAGSKSIADTFFAQQHQKVKLMLKDHTFLESINMSISGSSSEELFKIYQQNYLKFRPDLVVVNLSSNDGAQDIFEENIEKLLKLNQSYAIKTILLEEANSHEYGKIKILLQNHQILKKIAKAYNVPVYPLHSYLSQPEIYQTGKLWWDFVHLTSYGQTVVADWLAPKIFAELTSRKPRLHHLLKIDNVIEN